MGHHFVPQRYLRNFEDSEQPGLIWLHDKRGGTPRAVSIKNVFQAKKFYADETEKRLAAEIEAPCGKAMEKLVHGQTINEEERFSIARYTDVMLKRVPSHRPWVATLIPDALSVTFANARGILRQAEIDGQANPELIARRRQEIDDIERKYSRETPQWAIDKANDPMPSDVITQTFCGMTWRVLVSLGPQFFITTDNPAFFFRGYGLGNDQVEVSFPLSTTHALHCSWQRAGSDLVFMQVNQRTVREINRRLVSQTERLALYHKPATWIFNILSKPDLYLSRIQW
jgi:hypothetical protein